MRIFPIQTKDDGLYVTLRLDADEYQRLTRGQYGNEWDLEHQIIRRISALPGEVAVFLEALGNHIVSYAGAMSRSLHQARCRSLAGSEPIESQRPRMRLSLKRSGSVVSTRTMPRG